MLMELLAQFARQVIILQHAVFAHQVFIFR